MMKDMKALIAGLRSNPWTPVSPAQEASAPAVAARMQEYDRIAPRWRESRFQLKARARFNLVDAAIFALDHEAQTATFIESCSSYGTQSAPFLGVTAHIEPRGDYTAAAQITGLGLRLAGHPYCGDVVYRIVP